MNPLRADHISPLDMFKIGVGPSSSHTVAPMIAALAFRQAIVKSGLAKGNDGDLSIEVELYGSLSATGLGHKTDGAICAGLCGLHPQSAEPERIWQMQTNLLSNPFIEMDGSRLAFDPGTSLKFCGWLMDDGALPHPNTMRFRLLKKGEILLEEIILSAGGGFIEPIDKQTGKRAAAHDKDAHIAVAYPYNSASEFVDICNSKQLKPWQVVIANEQARGLSEKDLRNRLAEILSAMETAINSGLQAEGILPGGLNVRRRAKTLYEQLLAGKSPAWAGGDLRPSVYAMAVNEENAAGGRVVTAPTNGSSGIIPAVWRLLRESENLSLETLENGLITASVIGALVKTHASISGAEVGCQGEVGTSCAMAAGGAVAMLGGTPNQIEQAAEIGIEHHLGMTCDPIKGLVQVPCIERNAMGAVKALNACALSLASDGKHLVSLDHALEVMRQTGLDMNQKYKETATGGLALG